MMKSLLRASGIGFLMLSERLVDVSADHTNFGGYGGDKPVLPQGHHQRPEPQQWHGLNDDLNDLEVLFTAAYDKHKESKKVDSDQNDRKNLRDRAKRPTSI